jgi:hypothetical protein
MIQRFTIEHDASGNVSFRMHDPRTRLCDFLPPPADLGSEVVEGKELQAELIDDQIVIRGLKTGGIIARRPAPKALLDSE